jgi:hypothetical protein
MSNIRNLDLYRTKVMLELLNQLIPLRPPHLKWTEKEVWYYAGQRSVIDLIRRQLEEVEKPPQTTQEGSS